MDINQSVKDKPGANLEHCNENEVIVYTLEGDPIPLARLRISQNFERFWDSQKQIKLVCGLKLKNQHVFPDGSDRPLYSGPLHINVTFYMKIFKTGKQKPGSYHMFKPDLDNMLKFICDISNSVLWHDDAIISSANCRKIYDKNPRTAFTVTQLSGSHA